MRLAAKPRNRLLWITLLLGLLLRVGWVLSRGSSPASTDSLPDQREYLNLTDSLLEGRGLNFYDARFGSRLVSYRMPGYPMFLATCGGSIQAIRLCQALLDASTILATWLLATRCLPEGYKENSGMRDAPARGFPIRARWGKGGAAPGGAGALFDVQRDSNLKPPPQSRETKPAGRGRLLRLRLPAPALAALLVALNPFLIYFSGLILSETLFVTMMMWGIWLITVDRLAGRILGRLLLALSVLVRPSALLMPIALAVGAPLLIADRQNLPSGVAYARSGRWRGVAWSVLWTCLSILLVLLPWAIRNHRVDVLGRWVFLTTNGGITAYDGMNPRADGSSDQSFLRNMPELRHMDEASRSNYLQHLAEQFAKAHPLRAIQLAGLKIARTWSPMPLSYAFSDWRYRIVALLYSGGLYALALLGLIKSRLRPSSKVFLLIPAIYFTVVHAMSVGSLRYRLPAEPPMAILGASVFVAARASRAASAER